MEDFLVVCTETLSDPLLGPKDFKNSTKLEMTVQLEYIHQNNNELFY